MLKKNKNYETLCIETFDTEAKYLKHTTLLINYSIELSSTRYDEKHLVVDLTKKH